MDLSPGVTRNVSFPMYFNVPSRSLSLLTDQSVMKINNDLKCLLHTRDPEVTKMRNVSLLIRTSIELPSSILDNISTLSEVPVISTLDIFRNTLKCVIYTDNTKFLFSQEILEDLQKSFPVAEIYCFPPKRETPDVPNPHLLLTFSTPFPPSNVKIGYYYIP